MTTFSILSRKIGKCEKLGKERKKKFETKLVRLTRHPIFQAYPIKTF